MAFEDLGYILDEASKAGTALAGKRAHANNGRDGIANPGQIDLGMVAATDARVLHSTNTLRHRRGRESNALPKFAIRETCILLKFVQELPAGGIQQLFN